MSDNNQFTPMCSRSFDYVLPKTEVFRVVLLVDFQLDDAKAAVQRDPSLDTILDEMTSNSNEPVSSILKILKASYPVDKIADLISELAVSLNLLEYKKVELLLIDEGSLYNDNTQVVKEFSKAFEDALMMVFVSKFGGTLNKGDLYSIRFLNHRSASIYNPNAPSSFHAILPLRPNSIGSLFIKTSSFFKTANEIPSVSFNSLFKADMLISLVEKDTVAKKRELFNTVSCLTNEDTILVSSNGLSKLSEETFLSSNSNFKKLHVKYPEESLLDDYIDTINPMSETTNELSSSCYNMTSISSENGSYLFNLATNDSLTKLLMNKKYEVLNISVNQRRLTADYLIQAHFDVLQNALLLNVMKALDLHSRDNVSLITENGNSSRVFSPIRKIKKIFSEIFHSDPILDVINNSETLFFNNLHDLDVRTLDTSHTINTELLTKLENINVIQLGCGGIGYNIADRNKVSLQNSSNCINTKNFKVSNINHYTVRNTSFAEYRFTSTALMPASLVVTGTLSTIFQRKNYEQIVPVLFNKGISILDSTEKVYFGMDADDFELHNLSRIPISPITLSIHSNRKAASDFYNSERFPDISRTLFGNNSNLIDNIWKDGDVLPKVLTQFKLGARALTLHPPSWFSSSASVSFDKLSKSKIYIQDVANETTREVFLTGKVLYVISNLIDSIKDKVNVSSDVIREFNSSKVLTKAITESYMDYLDDDTVDSGQIGIPTYPLFAIIEQIISLVAPILNCNYQFKTQSDTKTIPSQDSNIIVEHSSKTSLMSKNFSKKEKELTSKTIVIDTTDAFVYAAIPKNCVLKWNYDGTNIGITSRPRAMIEETMNWSDITTGYNIIPSYFAPPRMIAYIHDIFNSYPNAMNVLASDNYKTFGQDEFSIDALFEI